MKDTTQTLINELKENLMKSQIEDSLDAESQARLQISTDKLIKILTTLDQEMNNLETIATQSQQLKADIDSCQENNQIDMSHQNGIVLEDVRKEKIKDLDRQRDNLIMMIKEIAMKINHLKEEFAGLYKQLYIPIYGFKVAHQLDQIKAAIAQNEIILDEFNKELYALEKHIIELKKEYNM